jgi:CspA family cold shock protein
MATGTVIRWIDDRGFGFIKCDEDSEELFVHVSGVISSVDALQPGQRVRFKQGINERSGRPNAIDVELIT